jgi:lipopolysaccharide heptosyltransferase II
MRKGISAPFNILVVRPDKIGDVVLSTPVFEALKQYYPHARITVMVRQALVPVLQGLPSVDEVIVFDPDRRHAGLRGLGRLVSDIHSRKFRVAIMLQSNRRIAAAVFWAGIRRRIGPLSKLHSFLFYNHGVRQRRSNVEMHEADYNLQLLRRLGIRLPTRTIPTRVVLSDSARKDAESWLATADCKKPFVAVHPGMAGSALNWPEERYVDLIAALAESGRQVLVTGGPEDKALLRRIRVALESRQAKMRVRPLFYGDVEMRGLDFLVALYSHASVVVAPSTGPLHLAVAVGCPVVAFYSPIKVQSALRWGPYLLDEARASVMVPDAYCGQDFECRGSICHYYPCMKGIILPQVLGEIERQLVKAESEQKNG